MTYMEQDIICLSSQEVADLALIHLDLVERIEAGEIIDLSWAALLREIALELILRREQGGSPSPN